MVTIMANGCHRGMCHRPSRRVRNNTNQSAERLVDILTRSRRRFGGTNDRYYNTGCHRGQ
jgi:hypothetical protein